MSSSLVTVEQAAERLKLHPKTVRRFIKEGRLRATRIGKAYRILESDLAEFAGVAPRQAGPAMRVTSVVDIEDVDAYTAERLARFLPAALDAREAAPGPTALNVLYDPERRQVKVMLAGSSSRVAAFLGHIELSLEMAVQR